MFILSNFSRTRARILQQFENQFCIIMSLLKALKDEESSTKLKLRDACISSTNAENNKRSSLDRRARQEELRCIVMQYKDLPIDVYMQTLVGYYNYDVLEN